MGLTTSRIVDALEPSATIAMAAKARELKSTGKTVYDFTLGEPDFTTPEHICAAAVAAMKAGHTHYTAAGGIAELKPRWRRHISRASRFGIRGGPGRCFQRRQAFAAQRLYHALNPGRRSDHSRAVLGQLCRASEIGRRRAGDRRDDRSRAISSWRRRNCARRSPRKTKICCCALRRIRRAACTRPTSWGRWRTSCIEKDLGVISDEIYEHLVYGDNRFASFATVRPGLAERTVLVNGVSKSYAMTGWRIGWTLSPEKLAKAMDNLQSQETSNPSSISQYAALAACRGPQQCVGEMLVQFAKRREFVKQRIASLPRRRAPR